MRLRLLVVMRLLGVWLASLACLMVLLGSLSPIGGIRTFWEALWLMKLLFVSSIPLAALASVVCFTFPYSISRYPFPWTLLALVTASGVAFSLAGEAGLIFSLMVSFPAAVMFLLSMRRWPIGAEN